MRWHRGEAGKRWLRHATGDTRSSDNGKPGGLGGGGRRIDTAADECRNKKVDWVAGYCSTNKRNVRYD